MIFAGFSSVAVNSVYKLLIFVFIFAVSLPISVFPLYIFMKFTRVNSNFSFSKWYLSPYWILKNHEILLANRVTGAKMRHLIKFN